MVNPNPNDWSIHDDKDSLVFPPINHENLKILSHPHSAPPSSDSQVRKGGWMSIGLQILRSKLSSFWNRAVDRGAIWSIGAALVMSGWIIIVIMRRKKSKRTNEARLINIIKEKDGKIAQLLHQIAQMNEILIHRHKALAAKVVE